MSPKVIPGIFKTPKKLFRLTEQKRDLLGTRKLNNGSKN